MLCGARAVLAVNGHSRCVLAGALAAIATVFLDLSGARTSEARFRVKVNRAAPGTKTTGTSKCSSTTANHAVERLRACSAALGALALDVGRNMIPEEPWRVFAFDGGSVGPLCVFGGTPEEILLEATFFHGAPVFFRFGLGHVAKQAATVRISLLLAAVVVLHDFLFVSEKALLVVDSGSEPEGGFKEGLEETAAATSTHACVLVLGVAESSLGS